MTDKNGQQLNIGDKIRVIWMRYPNGGKEKPLYANGTIKEFKGDKDLVVMIDNKLYDRPCKEVEKI
jgi:hypothetical protein